MILWKKNEQDVRLWQWVVSKSSVWSKLMPELVEYVEQWLCIELFHCSTCENFVQASTLQVTMVFGTILTNCKYDSECMLPVLYNQPFPPDYDGIFEGTLEKEHMRLVMEYIDEWNFVDDYPEERLVLWRTIEDLLLCLKLVRNLKLYIMCNSLHTKHS